MIQTCDFDYSMTARGFEAVTFLDAYGEACEVQQSSVIGDYLQSEQRPGISALWLGQPGHRMHLSREHVTDLMGLLDRWLKTGTLHFPGAMEPDDTTHAEEDR